MKNKNEIRKLEELGLGELRGKEYETRVDMFNAIENINKGYTFDRRTCQLFINNERYIIATKRKNKKYHIDYIVCDGIRDEWINEEGIKCIKTWYRFYK